MVVTLLSLLLCKSDDLILKLHQIKSGHLVEKWLLIGRFKVNSVPGMRNKHQPYLYINLHNELKSYSAKKVLKCITLCILKKEGG